MKQSKNPSSNETLSVKPLSHKIDGIGVTFDESNLVPNAGLLLVSTLISRLGLESLINEKVKIPSKKGGYLPGRKVLTLVDAMLSGASHIDHADILRAGATKEVLSHRVMASSTLGTFLRSFTFGHVRQLESAAGEALIRAWSHIKLPGSITLDVDSTICEVTGKKKQGAAYGYTKVLGYHPLLATRADTGEIIQGRMRKGSANTQRGSKHFVKELIANLRKAGANGDITLRFDSGFWSKETIEILEKRNVFYTMAVKAGNSAISGAISLINEKSFIPIEYTQDGEAEVSETTYKDKRLIVRRTRLTGKQADLFPNWRYFAFLTNLKGTAVEVDAFHRQRALTELDIRDLKEGSGMGHLPSGSFSANSAWFQCSILAHNLSKWTQVIGDIKEKEQRCQTNRTIRTRYFVMPGRLVNKSGKKILRAPTNWLWQEKFIKALDLIRGLQVNTS